MTTLITDFIVPSTGNTEVNVRNLVWKSPTFTNDTITFDSSGNSTGTSTTLAINSDISFDLEASKDPVSFAQLNVDNNFSSIILEVDGHLKVGTIQVNRLNFGVQPVNAVFPVGSSSVHFIGNAVNSTTPITTMNIGLNTPDSAPVNLTFPGTTGTLIGLTNLNTFTALQTFNSGIKTDSATATTTNSDLTLSGNGTGNVTTNFLQIQGGVSAKTTNGNLSISGNGTGTTVFDSNGIQFTSGASILKDYTTNSFVSQITCGTFNSGNVNIQFERIGKKVTLRIPVVTGSPNIDSVWNASNLPSNLQPTTTQLKTGSIGTRNNATLGLIYVKIQASSTWVLSFNSDVGGFGTTGTCGWQNTWSISYDLN